MITITDPKWNMEHCTGCSACVGICPKAALSMGPDRLGFLRPRHAPEQCIDCHLCEQVCPVLHPPTGSSAPEAVAATARDDTLLKQCSSGGVFPLLAKEILARGGAVYGAAFDKDFRVQHIRVDALQDLPRLYSSKYVQSDLRDTFRQAKNDLNAGIPVCFSGTPCQIAGFKSYLGKDYDHLITLDLVCHSVPSPEIWQHYKRRLENRQNSRLTTFHFRHKTAGWEAYSLHGEFEDGSSVDSPARTDPYMQGFVKGLYSRESCYHCPFKGISRCSDLTLGDFWGAHAALPQAYHPMGTSIAVLHTEKAKKLLPVLPLSTHPLPPEAAFPFNPAALVAAEKPKKHAFFHENRDTMDFAELVSLCCKPAPWELMKQHWNQSLLCRLLRKIRYLVSF